MATGSRIRIWRFISSSMLIVYLFAAFMPILGRSSAYANICCEQPPLSADDLYIAPLQLIFVRTLPGMIAVLLAVICLVVTLFPRSLRVFKAAISIYCFLVILPVYTASHFTESYYTDNWLVTVGSGLYALIFSAGAGLICHLIACHLLDQVRANPIIQEG